MSNNDVVYYNLTIGDNDPAKAGVLTYDSTPAIINAKNNMPILQNPDDYYGAIIRFQIPAINLPLITFLVQTNQPDINLGVYAFTITEGLNPYSVPPVLIPTASSGRVFVSYLPQVIVPASQIPSSPVGSIQQSSPYYLLYDYEFFIQLWNTALRTAHNILYPAESQAPPFFKYDCPSQLIQLYYPIAYVNSSRLICFNNQLLQFFVGMTTVNLNQGGLDRVDGCDNIIFKPVVNSVPIITINTEEYKIQSSQYNSYGYWNWLKTILITTNMNVNSEAVFDNNTSTSNYQNVNYVNILEDFMPDLAIPNGAGIQNQIFTYFAQSLYRVFTFNQKNPLYNVNLAISIVDTFGNSYPLTIPKGQSANFKLMFIKKSIYASFNKNLN